MLAFNLYIPKEVRGPFSLCLAASIWGCFPLYWHLLSFASTLDILANRIIWSFIFGIVALKLINGRLIPKLPETKELVYVLMAALFLSFNWGISIYAVQVERVVEGGIGMYFAPIFQILIGIIIFKESINRAKIIATTLLIISALILIFDLRSIPTIALGMGLSFAIYASIKKKVSTSSIASHVLESGAMTVPALVYMNIYGSRLTSGTPLDVSLLVGAGIVAAIPLILYGFGAKLVTLASSGMILTLIPIINIAVGAFLLGEHVTLPTGMSILFIVMAVFYYTFHSFRENSHA